MIFSGLWALTALFPSDGGCGSKRTVAGTVSPAAGGELAVALAA